MGDAVAQAPTVQVLPLKFREVLGHFPTGVVLVTAIGDDGEPIGMIVGTFASVSLDPPMVMYLPTKTSSTFARLRTSSSFCVNVLAADQNALVRSFAGKGENKFEGVSWQRSPSGAPIIDGVVASIDCEVDSIIEAGDHYIVLGSVNELEVHNPVAPLLFFQGGFGRFANLRTGAVSEAVVIEAERAAATVRPELESLAESLGVECDVVVATGDEVVVVATVTASGLEPSARLGQRTPLMPPLGEVFAAFGDDVTREGWLQRISPVDEYSASDYQRRLEITKERGWSLARSGEYRDHEFAEVARSSSAERLTPLEDRDLKSVVAKVSADHAPIDLIEGEQYSISGIVAPIVDSKNQVRLAVRMTQLPRNANAKQVEQWAEATRLTAEQISVKWSLLGSAGS